MKRALLLLALPLLIGAGKCSISWPQPTPSPSGSPTTEPTAEPTPQPTPTLTPNPTPTPTAVSCRGGVCPTDKLYVNAKPHGKNNYDSTMRCRDRAYCEKSTGIAGTVDCALGNEGTLDRIACEQLHAPGCHRWYFLDAGRWEQCLPAAHPVGSCDHYDQWQEWRWRDEGCHQTGCPTEYNPYTGICATDDKHEPIAGYQQIPHGKTQIIACGWGPSAKVCSKSLSIDQ